MLICVLVFSHRIQRWHYRSLKKKRAQESSRARERSGALRSSGERFSDFRLQQRTDLVEMTVTILPKSCYAVSRASELRTCSTRPTSLRGVVCSMLQKADSTLIFIFSSSHFQLCFLIFIFAHEVRVETILMLKQATLLISITQFFDHKEQLLLHCSDSAFLFK